MLIDVHSHLFNASDLPVAGFLKTRVPELPEWLCLVVEKMLQAVAPAAVDSAAEEPEILTDAEAQAILDRYLPEIEAARPDLAADIARARAAEEPVALEAFGLSRDSILGTIKWVHLMMRSRPHIAKRFFAFFDDVDLTLPLMVDLDRWLGATAETEPRERARKFEALIGEFRGKLHPLVCFDPRRVVEDDLEPLALVRECIEERGFLGVKVYPPMGFRPTGNDQTVPPLDRPQRYDEVLDQLFAYCADAGVPITTHCSPGGAEAGDQTGLNSDPKYWEPVLEKYPALRVNFAHFGGFTDLQEKGPDAWAWTIARLMDRFDGIYADTGHHGLFSPTEFDGYLNALKELFAAYPICRERLMYGTDFHMILRTNKHGQFLKDYRRFYALLVDDDRGASERFFAGNALRFLGLDNQRSNNHRRLFDYYQARGWTFPSWMKVPAETVRP